MAGPLQLALMRAQMTHACESGECGSGAPGCDKLSLTEEYETMCA